MGKLGGSTRIIAPIVLVLIVLFVVGFLFPVPKPHVSLAAEKVFHLGPIPIFNTFLAAWISIIVLGSLFYLGTRRMKLVPKGLQNVVELVVEMLLNFVEGVAGKENGRRFFPIVATIFLFVFMNAWLGLLPGFNTIGFGEHATYAGALVGGEHEGFVVNEPLLKAANTDINLPLALALISFIFVEYWGIRAIGLFRYASKFIRVGQLLRGKFLMGLVDVFVGILEALSELVRIISFTFRLFGNMTAGEVLLLLIAFLVPWVAAVPFYGLEMFFGFVQAFIFAGLTLVFATVAVTLHEEEH